MNVTPITAPNKQIEAANGMRYAPQWDPTRRRRAPPVTGRGTRYAWR
jgi:hypothetical protein